METLDEKRDANWLRGRSMADRNLVNLRRTITPYVGQTLILVAVTIFCAFVAYKTSEWKIFWSSSLIWLFYAGYAYIAMKYRVLWNETNVVMRASGLAERHIRYDEITEIRYELAQVSEFLSQARPFRRIVVHGRKHDPHAFIDISLRHFRLEDIEELLTKIRKYRPDLVVPTVPKI